jgi:N-acetylglucosamine-6-sulfatase
MEMKRFTLLIASMTLAVLLASGIATLFTSQAASQSVSQTPNIVLVQTDDMTKRDFALVPAIGQALGGHYAFFQESYVTTSLCCPSRATMFTGLYAHNHGVRGNLSSEDAGFARYKSRGWPTKDLPNWLQEADYETVLVGKYLNGYSARQDPPQPGWTEWYAAGTPTRDWLLNENGPVHYYPQDKDSPNYRHFDDVLTDKAVSYVNGRSADSPAFFMYVGYHASHGPQHCPAPL